MTRQKIDSIQKHVEIHAHAHARIVPPAHVPLQERDLPFFDSVIAEFAKSEWTGHQLECAAMLARMMSDMEEEQRLLREEGSILTTEKGHLVVSPRKTLVQMLAGSIFSMRRSLALHARAGGARTQDIAKRAKIGKKIEAAALETDDDLIARPH